ncbi:MAG: phenylalanine--tRNA ligase subunit alpha [Calditrichota bacterium]
MKDQIQQVRETFRAEKDVSGAEALETLRIRFLGKKGLVTGLFSQLGKLDASERPQVGKLLNELRTEVSGFIAAEKEKAGPKIEKDWIDVTLPGRKPAAGKRHPLTLVRDEIKQIFSRMGFAVAKGPEVESDYLCFEALNIPKHHPARDMQDTLYISEELVLRTHTSPVQIRTMQNQDPPVRIIAPGRVYRRDTPDSSHLPAFHQVEGLCVDKGISMGDLKAVLLEFARQMFGENTKLRFRPSFFPFTEPSAEVDIWWETSKGGRWLEILGCGMVHPDVLRNVNYDPETYSGYAFGMGIDRIAVLKYGIDDVRLLLENDMRFLEQL